MQDIAQLWFGVDTDFPNSESSCAAGGLRADYLVPTLLVHV